MWMFFFKNETKGAQSGSVWQYPLPTFHAQNAFGFGNTNCV